MFFLDSPSIRNDSLLSPILQLSEKKLSEKWQPFFYFFYFSIQYGTFRYGGLSEITLLTLMSQALMATPAEVRRPSRPLVWVSLSETGEVCTYSFEQVSLRVASLTVSMTLLL